RVLGLEAPGFLEGGRHRARGEPQAHPEQDGQGEQREHPPALRVRVPFLAHRRRTLEHDAGSKKGPRSFLARAAASADLEYAGACSSVGLLATRARSVAIILPSILHHALPAIRAMGEAGAPGLLAHDLELDAP